MRVAPLLVITAHLSTACVQTPALTPRPVSPSQAQDRSHEDAQLELAVFDRVNDHRRARGLAPLTLDARMNPLARLHSAAMAAGRVRVGHDGFAERASLLGQGQPKSFAENVAYDAGHADPAAAIVKGWLESGSHRQNIEGPYERTGIGVARSLVGEFYVTQLFLGTPKHARARNGAAGDRDERPDALLQVQPANGR
jgi:uncharacterized protein YkwD